MDFSPLTANSTISRLEEVGNGSLKDIPLEYCSSSSLNLSDRIKTSILVHWECC